MTTHERANALRARAEVLESDQKQRAELLDKAGTHAESFLSQLPSQRVYSAPGDRDEALDALAISATGSSMDAAMQLLDQYVDGVGHNLGSSRFFAYIPSGGLYESAVADFLASVTNRYSGVGFAAPGATRMEEVLIQWLARVIGYPAGADGDLTSGGSIAALSAVVTARDSFGIKGRDIERQVVYLTSQTHHTFRKALHIAGVGECVVRELPTDAGHRMRPDALVEAIVADRAAGLHPWFISASAGTTDVGAVDPLDTLADIAESERLWLHVDAAYGGGFALCDEGAARLAGLSRSDSLILDPHKGFFLPCGLGVVLVRDGAKLKEAYHSRGTYMQDMAHDTERSPCDLSPELTRPFRALRFWLPFKIHGTEPFAAALEEKLLLADYFQEQVAGIPGARVGQKPDLSIVPFRFEPARGDANAFNRRLINAIKEDGRVFMTSTTLGGRFTIRMAINGYNTHIEDVDVALDVIRELAAGLQAS